MLIPAINASLNGSFRAINSERGARVVVRVAGVVVRVDGAEGRAYGEDGPADGRACRGRYKGQSRFELRRCPGSPQALQIDSLIIITVTCRRSNIIKVAATIESCETHLTGIKSLLHFDTICFKKRFDVSLHLRGRKHC